MGSNGGGGGTRYQAAVASIHGDSDNVAIRMLQASLQSDRSLREEKN